MDSFPPSTLFGSVPDRDVFGIFQENLVPDSKKIADLLDYKKRDVARAVNVGEKSIRFDERMPKEVQDRIREWGVALNLVADHFQDKDKTVLWFRTPNPMLGDVSPRDMIRMGRFKKLLRFIQTALQENRSHA